MIKLVNVNKYYQSGNDRIHVIKDLNYEFPNTGLIFILGPSGSGKSTLLNLLGGLDQPDSGQIWIENRQISSFSKKELNAYLNSYLGFVFQEYNILSNLNLRDNISISLEIQGYSHKEKKAKVKQIINDVELTGLEKRKVHQLSGGQKQRIAIARALIKDPNLIIADEPTGNLDSETSNNLFKLFKKLSKDRLIIIVSHDEESALTYADDIIRFDTANVENDIIDVPQVQYELLNEAPTTQKLMLEQVKIPVSTISKLAFKNMWIKKIRYLLILLINIISLVFLSFAIELNGDKLYQNVYTTVNNNNNYTDIYQYRGNKNGVQTDFYSQYEKSELMDGAYDIIKDYAPDLILHKYQPVSIKYAGYAMEDANFLFTGKIDSIIEYDNSNIYNLIAGRLPDESEAEIMITDFLFDSLKHFDIIDRDATYYNILNKYIDLGYPINFKMVGIIQTNYSKWKHLTRYSRSHVVDKHDETMQGFTYDYLIMNSIIVGSYHYNYILNNSFTNTTTSMNNYEIEPKLVKGFTSESIILGNKPTNALEIVVPFDSIPFLFTVNSRYYSYTDSQKLQYIKNNFLNSSYDTHVTMNTKFNEIVNSSGIIDISAQQEYKLVGITDEKFFLVNAETFTDFQNGLSEAYKKDVKENIIVELSKDPNQVLQHFKTLYNNDYHFIIDIFQYQEVIESYNVNPIIKFASTGGLIVFTILAIGIMWTIISIEIVDSRKEIGIMRSIGLNGIKVSMIFLIQAIFINILAYFIAIPIAGKVINLYGSNLTDTFGKIHLSMYTLTNRSPLILLGFILVITLISTIVPLIKIISKKIIDIINERDK